MGGEITSIVSNGKEYCIDGDEKIESLDNQLPEHKHSSTTYGEALKLLNIEDYNEAIFNSNSHGELFHLSDYIVIADHIRENGDGDYSWFRKWFLFYVRAAKDTWQRPESVYQHMVTLWNKDLERSVSGGR